MSLHCRLIVLSLVVSIAKRRVKLMINYYKSASSAEFTSSEARGRNHERSGINARRPTALERSTNSNTHALGASTRSGVSPELECDSARVAHGFQRSEDGRCQAASTEHTRDAVRPEREETVIKSEFWNEGGRKKVTQLTG